MSEVTGLLDTSVVIDLDLLDASLLPHDASISAITLAELSAGPIVANNDDERLFRQMQLQLAEAHFNVLPFDSASARTYAIVYSRTIAAGRKPRGSRAVDLMIASTAIAHQLPLYTRNPKDFDGLDGIVEIVAV